LNKQSLTILKETLPPGAKLLIITTEVFKLFGNKLKRNNGWNYSPKISSKVDNWLIMSWKSLRCLAMLRYTFNFRSTSLLIRKPLLWVVFLSYRPSKLVHKLWVSLTIGYLIKNTESIRSLIIPVDFLFNFVHSSAPTLLSLVPFNSMGSYKSLQ